jgi:hypothetical protein
MTSSDAARVVLEVGDRRFESEVVTLPFDPAVRIWIVPGQVLRSADEPTSVIYLDPTGHQVVLEEFPDLGDR